MLLTYFLIQPVSVKNAHCPSRKTRYHMNVADSIYAVTHARFVNFSTDCGHSAVWRRMDIDNEREG